MHPRDIAPAREATLEIVWLIPVNGDKWCDTLANQQGVQHVF